MIKKVLQKKNTVYYLKIQKIKKCKKIKNRGLFLI